MKTVVLATRANVSMCHRVNMSSDNRGISDTMICPITYMVFRHPVIASDGHIYERDAITRWYARHQTSPLTRQQISDKFYECHIINELLDKYLTDNPDCVQYTEELSIDQIIECRDVEGLLTYLAQNNNLSIDEDYLYKYVWMFNHVKVAKYMIDHHTRIQTIGNLPTGRQLIHMICDMSPPSIIRYAIERRLDLESLDGRGWRPVHYIFSGGDEECNLAIIESGVNITSPGLDGELPIACLVEEPVTIPVLQKLDKNILTIEIDRETPLHKICRKSDRPVIGYLMTVMPIDMTRPSPITGISPIGIYRRRKTGTGM